MRKVITVLVACFSLLLGLVLMDVSYTGSAVMDIDTSLYDGSNLAIAFSVIIGILITISLVFHQINKPIHDELKRHRL